MRYAEPKLPVFKFLKWSTSLLGIPIPWLFGLEQEEDEDETEKQSTSAKGRTDNVLKRIGERSCRKRWGGNKIGHLNSLSKRKNAKLATEREVHETRTEKVFMFATKVPKELADSSESQLIQMKENYVFFSFYKTKFSFYNRFLH